MKRTIIKISLLLATVIFCLCGNNPAFAANADVSGLWIIEANYPPQNVHVEETTVWYNGKTEHKSYDEINDTLSIFSYFAILIEQKADGTISGGFNQYGVSAKISGKVTGNTVNFTRNITVQKSSAGLSSKATMVENFSGTVTGGILSGKISGSFYEEFISKTTGVNTTTEISSGAITGTFSVTLLQAALDTIIISGPQGTTNARNVSFNWIGTGGQGGIAGYYYQLDAGAKVYTTSTSITFNNLSLGAHIFSVAAKDKAGNVDATPAVNNFTIESVKPPEPPADAKEGKPRNPEESTKDPINLVVGNMYIITSDLTLPGKGLIFDFSRAYNSQEEGTGPFGFGWTHSYNLKLKQDPTTFEVKLKDEEAKGYLFAFNPNGGTYVSQRGEYSALTKNTSGFTWTKKDGKQYLFDLNGNLTQIKDRSGNTIKLSYDSQKLLTTITDTAGRQINLTYDKDGKIIRLSAPSGRNFEYRYDSQGNLIGVTDPAGPNISYEYDSNHNLTRKIDALGYSTYFTYDTQDRCTSSSGEINLNRTTLSFDPANQKTTLTDSKGNTTTYYYNTDLLITKIINPQGSQTTSTWDANLNRTSRTNELGRATTMQYDAKGNLTKVVDALGNITTFTYEPNFNLLKTSIDAQGNTTTNTYDTKGNLTCVTDAYNNQAFYTYNGAGQVTGAKNVLGKATYFTYDAQGNLISVKDPLGYVTTFTYDAAGNLTQSKDPKGNITKFTYDNLNRLTKTTYADNSSLSYTYNAVGNRIVVTDALGNNTYYTYTQDREAKTTTNALGHIISYDYDTEGNLISVIDQNNNKTTYGYDSLNRLISQTDAFGNLTQYQYDAAANRTAATDAKGQTTYYTYDTLNRLTEKGLSPQGTVPSSVVTYAYDSLSRRTKMADSSGATNYTYDKLGRLLKVDGPLAKDTLTYTYDKLGNRLTLTDPDAKITKYAYDALNRLASLTDPQNKITTYVYDAVGNLTTLTYPNGTKAAYTYDNLNRLLKLTQQKTAAPYTKLAEFNYTYDKLGRRTKVTLLDASFITYAYDANSQLIEEKRTSSSDPYQINYTYDPAGNRTWMLNQGLQHFYSYNSLNQLTQEDIFPTGKSTTKITVTGTVSDSNGIKSVTVNNLSATLQGNNFTCSGVILNEGKNTLTITAIDSLGNTTTKTLQVTYDPANQIIYTYDQNGNLIRKDEPGKFTNLTYDPENRLTEVKGLSPQGTVPITYTYDGEGKRTSAKEGAVTTNYLYDGLNVILERNSSGTTTATYTRNPLAPGGIGGIIKGLTPQGSVPEVYYHYDGLGSVTNLTNSSGAITQSYTYDAFGNLKGLTPQGSIPATHQFLTKETNSTGLIYFGARYYDPRIGRFITQDPSGMSDGPNLYLYCSNNPINFIDPWGLCKDKPWWEKLAEGYYYGTGFGQEAAEWYTQQQLQTGNPLWAIPGSVASLWTPETYQATAGTLLTGASLSGWAASTGMNVGLHPAHHTFRIFGKDVALKHIQITLWEIGKKGSHKIFRIPLP